MQNLTTTSPTITRVILPYLKFGGPKNTPNPAQFRTYCGEHTDIRTLLVRRVTAEKCKNVMLTRSVLLIVRCCLLTAYYGM